MNIGIVSYGLYIPAGFETADEVALKANITSEEVMALVIKRKRLPSEDDQPVPMAVNAAKQALLPLWEQSRFEWRYVLPNQ